MKVATCFVIPVVLLVLSSCATSGKRMVKVERTMTVTGYCACKECCNWKRNWLFKPVVASGPSKGDYKKPRQTASGVKAKHGTIAADKMYPFGTVMRIPGYGKGVVEDRGGAITGDHIDLFFKSHKAALDWGKQTLPVTIWLPEGHPALAQRR